MHNKQKRCTMLYVSLEVFEGSGVQTLLIMVFEGFEKVFVHVFSITIDKPTMADVSLAGPRKPCTVKSTVRRPTLSR